MINNDYMCTDLSFIISTLKWVYFQNKTKVHNTIFCTVDARHRMNTIGINDLLKQEIQSIDPTIKISINVREWLDQNLEDMWVERV